MARQVKFVHVLLCIMIAAMPLNAMNLQYADHLSIKNNLSHNGITCILEDSRGYMWIGTYDGLNKYDGYEFKTYKNTVEKTILNSNRIRSIAEDVTGNLWIGTDEGLSVYHYSENRFQDIYSNIRSNKGFSGPVVRDIIFNETRQNIYCITEGEGILEFSQNFKFINQHIPPWSLSKNSIKLYNAIALDSINYVFSTNIGILGFSTKTEEFALSLPGNNNQNHKIIIASAGKLLSCGSDGLKTISYTKKKNKFSFEITHKAFLDLDLKTIAIDPSKKLWLGTLNEGIVMIDNLTSFLNDKSYNTFIYNPNQGRLRASCFAFTENSGCWTGTFNKGIVRFDVRQNPFSNAMPSLKLRSNSINEITPADDNKVYIISNKNGLNHINTETKSEVPIPFQITEEQRNRICTAFRDSKNNLWIRFSRKPEIFMVRAGSTKLLPVKHRDGSPFTIQMERGIKEDRHGNLWIKTTHNLLRINFEKGKVSSIDSLRDHAFFSDKNWPVIRFVYPDPKFDVLWLGTDKKGLFRIIIKKNDTLKDAEITQFKFDPANRHSLPSNFVSSMVRINDGKLWLGTEGGGICQLSKSNHSITFINYSEKDGLSNNVVKSIQADNEGKLWISTNIGLNKFDPISKKFRIFRTEDGLPFEDFHYFSSTLDDGILIFAGVTDFCFFNPSDIFSGETLPKINFSKLRILNKTINAGDTIHGRIILSKQLNEQKQITLKHNENIFSIDVTALHYANPDNHFIQYQLLPVNDEWVQVESTQRTINYSGLQPGEYRLKVKASNSLKEWTKPKTLKIIIKPPFWLTFPAILIYLVIIILIISSVWRYMKKMNSLRHSLEIEQMEKDQAKTVNVAKLRFFSNISHEIKTPLTLISSPIESMLERYKANEELKTKLQMVRRQSKKISRLVDQVHDFQRADANKLKMEITVFNFNEFIKELITDFDFVAKKDNKNLKLQEDKNVIYVSADRDKLEKIFNNLLTNAFKFTKADDTIELTFSGEGKNLKVSVKDNGRGIHEKDLPHIFERFFQSIQKGHEYTGGSGIGLAFSKRLAEMHFGDITAESVLSKGTSIHVKLPVITSAPSQEQKLREEQILKSEQQNESKENSERINPSKIKVEGDFEDASIFFVEDNTEMRTYVSEILSHFFKVRTFENGKECATALDEEWPDIVVSDVLMPEMNGFELCKNIKSNIKISHIPVILLTACTAIEDEILGLEVGADAYIKKPFNVQHLVTRVETLLQNRKKLRERFKIDFPLKLEKAESQHDLAFLERMYAVMDENLDNSEFDIDKCARKLYLNRTLLYQKVKAITNQTPFEMIKMYRLKRAAELLAENKLSVNEVYAMTGFKSRSNFSKIFKERYGCTPGNYASEALKKMEER